MADLLLLLSLLFLSTHYGALGSLSSPGIHIPIHRRGGRFARHEPVNLTKLDQTVTTTKARYLRTYRDVQGNGLVRRWHPDFDEEQMLDEIGLEKNWFFRQDFGEPVQSLEVDLDMLSPDFYSVLTSSGKGSKYDTFLSTSHVPADRFVHYYCRLASDRLRFQGQEPMTLDWPLCQPSHSSRHTLRSSGTTLGLAPVNSYPTSSLSRLDIPSFLRQLHNNGKIPQLVWSITLFDSDSGVLSLGGTLAQEVEEAKARTEAELKYLGQTEAIFQIEAEVRGRLGLLGTSIEEQFRWVDVHGAAGWWMGLISGVWIDGVKIMKNQPFLIDLSCPFILAPQTAFRQLYTNIGGSRLLPEPYECYATFPCSNQPHIAIEIAGWNFPITGESTRADDIHGPVGGRFSLGKLNDMVAYDTTGSDVEVNSGFCVGSVVGTGMRMQDDWKRSGMKDVWVLGEPFLRGTGVVFETGKKPRMGFRSY